MIKISMLKNTAKAIMKANWDSFRRMAVWVPVLLWMAVIYLLSAQPAEASNGLSTDLTGKLLFIAEKLGLLHAGASNDTNIMDGFNNFLRQFAHGFAYFILSLFVMNAFRIGGRKLTASVLPVFFICAAYALSDELHQFFVPGRATQFVDFMTDCDGVLSALVLYAAVLCSRRLLCKKRLTPNRRL